MSLFLFFLLQSSLILIKTFVTGSSILGCFFYSNEDEEYAEDKSFIKFPAIISPSFLDLNSLNLEGDQKFNEKRKKENNSPISPIGYSSRNNSPSYININEYSHPRQVLTVEDDYFFLYLDNSENNPRKYESSSNPSRSSNSIPIRVKVNSVPKLNE